MTNAANAGVDTLLEGFEDLNFEAAQPAPQNAQTNLSVVPQVGANAPTNVPVDVARLNSLVASGQQALQAIMSELGDLFLERHDVIRDAIRALIVGQSMLILGPPGTGKSALINALCNRITAGTFFSWLLNPTSDPAEILGPHSLKGMERDQFLRKTAGKLPEALIAFLDEIFKCNGPTLNTLLPIINEKVFYNDGKPMPIPLISLFGASNEPPEDDSLDALYDRLLFRHRVDYIKDPANIQRMFENYTSNSAASLKAKTVITIEELKALQDKAKLIAVDKAVLKVFINMLAALDKKHNITVSDRRKNECLKIMRGNAVLEGRDRVTVDDLSALVYVLWQKEEDIPKIEDEIAKLVNPYDDQLREFTKKFKEIKDNIDGITNADDKSRTAIEAKAGLESIVKKMDSLIKDAENKGKDATSMKSKRDEIINYNQQLMNEALGFNLDFGNGKDSPF